jgi:hypothetical protein
MPSDATVAVSTAVVALTMLVKWAGLKDSYGPLAVLALSAFGVAFWGWSKGVMTQTMAFDYFVGWIAVATSAAGVFGFTRSIPASVTTGSPRSVIPGAAQNPTEKANMDIVERRDR